MTEEEKDLINSKLMESKKIRKLYDDYVVKTIPFDKWVKDTTNYLLLENHTE